MRRGLDHVDEVMARATGAEVVVGIGGVVVGLFIATLISIALLLAPLEPHEGTLLYIKRCCRFLFFKHPFELYSLNALLDLMHDLGAYRPFRKVLKSLKQPLIPQGAAHLILFSLVQDLFCL